MQEEKDELSSLELSVSELSESVESVKDKDNYTESQRKLIDSGIVAKVQSPRTARNKPSTFGSLEDDFGIVEKPYEP